MATVAPATGAVAPTAAAVTATTTITPTGVDAITSQNNQARLVKTAKSKKKCCFNEPGGPWPRNIMLQAATCPDINKKLMTLVVGREEVHFTWFREVLSFHSTFFAGAIKHAWSSESKTGVVKMPEDLPDVVREFIRWITDHRLGGYGTGSFNPSLSPWDYWDLMVELFIFGNKYNIPRIQNVAINEIISLFHDQFAFPRASTIDKIYELTPQGAPLRGLVTDMIVLSHENVEALIDGQSRFGDGFHSDFVQDLVKRLYRAANHEKGYRLQRLARHKWGQVNRCNYHVSEVSARSNGKKVLARSHAENLP